MKVKFNFNLNVWLDEIEIEADSYAEAEDKLNKATVEELIEQGIISGSSIEDIDSEIVERTVDVDVTNIEYDLTEIPEEFSQDDIDSLPTELSFSDIYETEDDDIEDLIDDLIEEETQCRAVGYEYSIVKAH